MLMIGRHYSNIFFVFLFLVGSCLSRISSIKNQAVASRVHVAVTRRNFNLWIYIADSMTYSTTCSGTFNSTVLEPGT